MKKLRLFPKLMLSFFVFAVSVFLVFAGSLFLTAFFLDRAGDGILYAVADETGNPATTNQVDQFGGWIEKLDADLSVLEVYGRAKTQTERYTPAQLADLTGSGEASPAYIGFLGREVNGTRLLTIYDRNDVNVQPTVVLTPGADRPVWARGFFVLFGVLFLLLVALMSAYLVRHIRRPLDAITDGMRRVREGDEGVRLDFTAERDFAEIRDTFNAMMEDREQREEEKRTTAEKRSRFLLGLSHDLRTPVATVKSVSRALSAGLVPAEEAGRYYDVIEKKADRIDELSRALFTLLKLDDTTLQPVTAIVDLSELLREVAGDYYNEMEAKGLTLDAHIPDDPVPVMIDASLMKRAVGNLIENAIKYNQTGNVIGISLRRTDTGLSLRISDDGEAIPAAFRPQMFDAFTRADPTRSTEGGTGLGLSIAQTIVEKHGGILRYEARDGNHFVMDLPELS